MIPARFTPFARGAAYDAAALAWFAAVVTAGGTVSGTRKGYIDTLIKGLKSDGVWTKLDCLWLFAAENTQSALLDLVGLRTAAPIGTPTHTTDRGYVGGIDTTWNGTTHGVNYTLNSAHLMVYDRTARSDSANVRSCGTYNGATGYGGIHTRRGGTWAVAVNDTTSIGGTVADASGIWVASRTSSVALAAYRNGSSIGSSGAVSTTGLISTTMHVGGFNNNGSIAETTTDEHGAFGAGGALNSTEAAALTTRVRDYMNSVGA